MDQRPIMAPGAAGMRWGAFVVLAAYTGLYGWLLLKTAFQPFVMDNNESWSVLWHAQNLFRFGLESSMGLADEAFSPDQAAHPFVHTHQGNFPRLFGLLLYALGARSIESQIAITTFTVGIASIWLAYRFFAGFGAALYGTIAALVLMSDYILFAQWQVNTYRVWYGFLFFGALLLMQLACRQRSIRLLVGLGLVHAALFYGEIVFAVFVALAVGSYALALDRGRLRAVLPIWLAQGAGAALAVVILVGQLVAFYGWNGLVQDVKLTLLARSHAADPRLLRAELESFIDNFNIAFWHNFSDGSQLMSPKRFLESFFHYDLQTFTPLMVVVAVMLFVAFALGRLGEKLSWDRTPWEVRVVLPAPVMLLVPSWYLFLVNLVSVTTISAAGVSSPVIVHASLKITIIAAVAAVAASALLVALLKGNRSVTDARTEPRFLLVSLYLLLLVAFLCLHGALYDRTALPIVAHIASRLWPLGLVYGALAAVALVGAAVVVVGPSSTLPPHDATVVRRLGMFLACAIAAYAVIYVVFPGYVYSGYLSRSAPFTVFITVPAVATALWLALRVFLVHMRKVRVADGPTRGSGQTSSKISISISRTAVAAAASVTGGFIIGYWAVVQATYVDLFPPDQFAFLKDLRHEPFRGRTAVVNNYGAPVAAATGAWAYYDPVIESGEVRLTLNGYQMRRDARTYLWFADRKVNSEYLTPDFFVCMVPRSRRMVAAILSHSARGGAAGVGCESKGLVRMARKNGTSVLRPRLIAYDEGGEKKRGYASWAVVALDHDLPPHLAQLGGAAGATRVAIASEPGARERRLVLSYDQVDQSGRSVSGAKVRLLQLSTRRSCGDTASARVLIEGTDIKRIPFPPDYEAAIQAVITPAAGNKLGEPVESRVVWLSKNGLEPIDCLLLGASGRLLGLTAAPESPTAVSLRWDADPWTNGYRIRMRRGCGAWQQIGEVPPGFTSYRIADLSAVDSYSFEVEACSLVNGCAKGRVVVLGADASALVCPIPKRPRAVSAQRSGPWEIDLAWSEAGRGSEYRIEMQRGCQAMNEVARVQAESARFRVHDVSDKHAYKFRLRECAGGQCSDYSEEVVVPDAGAALPQCPSPAVPRGVKIVREKASELRVVWQPEPPETTYRIEFARSCNEFRDGGYIADSRGQYTIGDIDPGALYRVRVRECVGGSCSEFSPVIDSPGLRERKVACLGPHDNAALWSRQWIR